MSSAFGVSVVIPARNGLPDVLEAVRTALDQSLPPHEVVVVDDGSSDGTGEAVAQRFGGRVTVLHGRHGSAAAARNAGWRAATASWIAFLDADDLWFPDKLTVAAARIAAHPEARWFFSDGAFRTLDGLLHRSWLELYADLPEDYVGQPVGELCDVNFILTSSVMVRRDLLEAEGGFDERMSHAEDLDLWIRLARRAAAVASSQPLVRYQHREGGLTQQVSARLLGDVALFRRLGNDPSLSAEVRARARRRESRSHYKLAIESLRSGRGREARAQLAHAWALGHERGRVALAFAASLLPRPILERLRRQHWATRSVGVRLVRSERPAIGEGAEAAARGGERT